MDTSGIADICNVPEAECLGLVETQDGSVAVMVYRYSRSMLGIQDMPLTEVEGAFMLFGSEPGDANLGRQTVYIDDITALQRELLTQDGFYMQLTLFARGDSLFWMIGIAPTQDRDAGVGDLFVAIRDTIRVTGS